MRLRLALARRLHRLRTACVKALRRWHHNAYADAVSSSQKSLQFLYHDRVFCDDCAAFLKVRLIRTACLHGGMAFIAPN